jgi:hypothetical protein
MFLDIIAPALAADATVLRAAGLALAPYAHLAQVFEPRCEHKERAVAWRASLLVPRCGAHGYVRRHSKLRAQLQDLAERTARRGGRLMLF